ncbi:MAG: UDP-N-acetylglucosamine 2-epimerase (non-hydrolyzing) [Deltaproteobacteria bacterium]|nr:UDP-N-acetylglucosamine 2-epimerase (non-hydrolyzing) [Deltaproteobacteria bacterium]
MKIANVVGVRPNFVKIAPLIKEMRRYADIESILIHTGQHYDVRMAGQFFEDLQIPLPDVSLEVGSGSHAAQTSDVMKRIESVFAEFAPDVVVVVGDVNSTLAAALTAAKLQIPVAHVEAGLRSFDRTMPEEINRLVTDAIADYLFVTEESGQQNLLREGVGEQKIFFVGNVMIDSLESSRASWEKSLLHTRLGVERKQYGIVTLHRPSNVDDEGTLRGLLEALGEIAQQIPLIFPVHPRTRGRLQTLTGLRHPLWFGAENLPAKGICCLEPVGYLDFMALVAGARIVLTDSGGLQEETSALGVPCLTLRANTERPVTVTHGTNQLVGTVPQEITKAALSTLSSVRTDFQVPPLWDGKAAQRIVAILRDLPTRTPRRSSKGKS